MSDSYIHVVIQYFSLYIHSYIIPFLFYSHTLHNIIKQNEAIRVSRKEKWQIELVTLKHFIAEVRHSKSKLIEF